jgi:hypothetical protein
VDRSSFLGAQGIHLSQSFGLYFCIFFFLNLFIFFTFIYTFTFCGSISLVMLQVSMFDCAFVVIYLPHLYIYLGFFLSWFKSCEVDLGIVLSSLYNEFLFVHPRFVFLNAKVTKLID